MLAAPNTMTSTSMALRPWVEAWIAGTPGFVTAGP
jgi:hypothetical protein